MKIRLLVYFFRQAIQSLVPNGMVHAVGLGTMVVSLLIFGSFLLLFVNLSDWVEGWGENLTMSVYLEDGLDEKMKQAIMRHIQGLEGASVKEYISKERALEHLRAALGERSDLLESLSRNPLPASIEVIIRRHNPRRTDPAAIVKGIAALPGVSDVQYSEEWVNRFRNILEVVRLTGFIIGGLLGAGVIFIVTNTIKLGLYARQDEIEILKLVGATDWFVKIPFLMEGILQGLLSGFLANAILFVGYLILAARKTFFLGVAPIHFTFIPFDYALVILAVSAILGLIGSFIALGRFFNL
ncbi:MAG: hypothetical protein DRH20_00415 [Deltaproteobacteria bacterium]|nr:MAG: hypothetical protein DRH20_00415 [Deltaproteobacteria bacterium]